MSLDRQSACHSDCFVAELADFCLQAGQKEAVLSLIEQVEATNPLEAPTEHLEQCQGSWRLLFSTVTILVHAFDSLPYKACTAS